MLERLDDLREFCVRLASVFLLGAVVFFAGLFYCGSTSAWVHGSSSCPVNDGSAGAPNATIQHPTLLDGYAKTITTTLGCGVAGVTYAVGYPTSTSLTDPTLGGLPAGASYSAGVVTVSGSSPVTLNAWDFSLHGGVSVRYTGTGGFSITNCKFSFATGLSSTGLISLQSGSSGGLTFNNNIVDGGGTAFVDGSISSLAELIFNNGGGNVTLQYNWIKNIPANPLAQIGSGTVTYKYNLLENTSQYPSNHLNYLQWDAAGATSNAVSLQFNTTFTYNLGGAGGEGFQFYNNNGNLGAVLTSADVGYNTMIAQTTNPNAVARQNSTTYTMGQVLTIGGSAFPDYMICAGSSWTTNAGLCNGGTGTSTCTTASSPPATYASAGSRVTITDGTCFAQGEAGPVSIFLHGSNDSSTFNTKVSPGPASVHDNFFDATGTLNGNTTCGADGVFYIGVWGTANGPSGTVAWTAPTNNYNMVTGTSVCGTYPFLLKRDLNPANDNTPMWLNAVA